MGSTVDRGALKREILRILEEDREFRYALMGLLGFREILDRITRLEERQQRLEERFAELAEGQQRLEERFQRLEERVTRLEERFAELEERFAKLEERFARLEERFQQLEERVARLEERFAELAERVVRLEERFAELAERVARLEERYQALDERVARIEEMMMRHDLLLAEMSRRLSLVELEVGALSESFYARSVWEEIREETLGRGERILERRRNARVDGMDVDLLVVTEGRVYVVEVKVRPKCSDVEDLHRKLEAVSRAYPGREPVAVLAGALVGDDVEECAERRGVRVYRI